MAALLAIALIVVLITVLKVHPFLALIAGGLHRRRVAGQNIPDVIDQLLRRASVRRPPASAS